ncbi:MAG TPA: ATP-binding protein [Elusimicrobiales bacterium]|nr:ATP-binding protein [Elusimicrobiales bacterium]
MKLAVASGKGGTGKTSLACALARVLGPRAALLDCDVEEPNAGIFLKPSVDSEVTIASPAPVIDPVKCKGHGRCQEVCEYNAIKLFNGKPFLFEHLCHSCGGCVIACPEGAVTERQRPIGVTRSGMAGDIFFADGLLNIGEAAPVPLIKAVKKLAPPDRDIIIDCPPGTSCPMINAVKDADFCLLVSEPTPFGLSDLKIAVETLRRIKVPHALIINRSDKGDGGMERWCAEEKLEILLKIPFDIEIARAYSRGETMVEARPEYVPALRSIFSRLRVEAET